MGIFFKEKRLTAETGWIQEGRTDFSAASRARITWSAGRTRITCCLVTTTMWTA